MSQKRIPARELAAMLLAAGALNADQTVSAKNGNLAITYDEIYQRAWISNSGSNEGVSAYDLTAEKDYGIQNLAKGCKLEDDFVITHIRTRIAKVTVASGTVTKDAATLKQANFSNLLQIAGANQTANLPQALVNSEWNCKIDSAKQFGMMLKNFFSNNNRKEYIEASLNDCVEVPNSIIFAKKGKTLTPVIYLPLGVTLPTTDTSITDIGYAVETTYLGFRIGQG